MVWYSTFDSTFWLAIGALTSSTFALILRFLFKSKCKRFSCCGIFVVERDIENEIREQEMDNQQQHTNATIPETTIHNDTAN